MLLQNRPRASHRRVLVVLGRLCRSCLRRYPAWLGGHGCCSRLYRATRLRERRRERLGGAILLVLLVLVLLWQWRRPHKLICCLHRKVLVIIVIVICCLHRKVLVIIVIVICTVFSSRVSTHV
jgi:hypothetical protein